MDAVMKKEMKVVEEEKFQLMRVSEEEKRMEGFLFETFILHCMQTHSKNWNCKEGLNACMGWEWAGLMGQGGSKWANANKSMSNECLNAMQWKPKLRNAHKNPKTHQKS